MSRRTGRKRKPVAVTLPVIEVDNPLYSRAHAGADGNPQRITVAYNPRESYTGWLVYKGLVTSAEYRAASRVRQAFERMGGAGMGGADLTREPVDGGQIAKSITDEQLLAGAVLRECRGYLGPAGHDLVVKLAGQCLWPRDLAPRDPTKQKYLSMRFRECLETLAVHWGYQRQRDRAWSA